MAAIIHLTDVEKQLEQLNFPKYLEARMGVQQTNAFKLSKLFGKNRNFFYLHSRKNDQVVSILLLLSNHLQTNLFDPFLDLMPESIRTTKREIQLAKENEDLKNELEALKKERDLLKEIAMGRR